MSVPGYHDEDGSHLANVLPELFDQRADAFTKFTRLLVVPLMTIVAFLVFVPGMFISQLGRLLLYLTLGLYPIVYSLILWVPVLLMLMATSWMWFRIWPLRPVLLVLGIPSAVVGIVVVYLAPRQSVTADIDSFRWKVAYAFNWPYSWPLLQADKKVSLG